MSPGCQFLLAEKNKGVKHLVLKMIVKQKIVCIILILYSYLNVIYTLMDTLKLLLF